MAGLPNLDLLVPTPETPRDGWRWGTIITASPATVHLDNDPAGVYLPADSPEGLPVVGARVWCQLHGSGRAKRVVIVSQPVDGFLPGDTSFTTYSPSTAPSGWEDGVTIGNTGSDSGWPTTFASLYVFKANNNARVVQMVIKSGASTTSPTLIWVRASDAADGWGDWQCIGGGNPSAWRSDLTISGSYGGHGSYPLRFRRDGDWIYMVGLLTRASNWSANATATGVITLPAGSRPERNDFYPGASNLSDNDNCTFVVNTSGAIDIRTHGMATTSFSSAFFSLNSIIFYSPPTS